MAVIGKRPTRLSASAIHCEQLRSSDQTSRWPAVSTPAVLVASVSLCDRPRFKERPKRAIEAAGSVVHNQGRDVARRKPTLMADRSVMHWLCMGQPDPGDAW